MLVRNILVFLMIMINLGLWGQDSTSLIIGTDSLSFADSVIVSSPPISDDSDSSPTFLQRMTMSKGLIPLIGSLFILFLLYSSFSSLSKGIERKIKTGAHLNKGQIFDLKERLSTFSATKNVIKILGPMAILIFLLYIAIIGTSMQGYVLEWTNLLIRWAHVVAGIMWIGASFYFIFLENNLNRTKNIRDELAGNLWAVHGGGFYFLEKYKVAPKEIPNDLHWFKYEAYFTFLTGFALLVVVYYLDAKSFLIDPTLADLSIPAAIALSLGTLVAGWLIYDFLCKSALILYPRIFSLIGTLILIGGAYFLTHVFNSRAAYIHVGAIIGTMMVGNVFFNIIPAQKAMVRSALVGEELDASLGKKAGQRSLHNNYLTLPVIFIMISNHFPSTFGHQYNWLVLAVIGLASAGIKHYWNLIERGKTKTYILVFSVISILSLALVTSPVFEETIDMANPVSFNQAKEIIELRCVQCHSANPTDDVWKSAPNGVMYDTPEQIKNLSDKILTRAVRTKNMPQGNKTKMTDEERTVLKRWILQGAKIDQ